MPETSSFRRRRLVLSVLCAALLAVFLAEVSPAGRRLLGAADSENIVVQLRVRSTAGSGLTLHMIGIPEKRIPSTGNDSTQFTVEVRGPDSLIAVDTATGTTTAQGAFSGIVLDIEDGTYDFTFKGYSHLRRKLRSITVSTGSVLDFTDDGDDKLLCGDVNGTDGDNEVNGIDLSLMTSALLGSVVRYDVNRDGVVNGIDLTDVVANLNVTGDS